MPKPNASAMLLPTPGIVWGSYPERRGSTRESRPVRASARRYGDIAREARTCAERWRVMESGEREAALAQLRAQLRREGLTGVAAIDALGCVASVARETLCVELFDTQFFAAAVLLDGHLAEMATGEGKTYAAAAAATVAALAGVPVHVITANDYLAGRDASALAPLYGALGLTVGTIAPGQSAEARRSAYACDIVYCTARELVFDYLRDRHALGAVRSELARRAAAITDGGQAQPLLRGLCMAIVDEADSVLIDEATMPLILSESLADPQHRAFLWQALALARELRAPHDFSMNMDARTAELTVAGEERLASLASGLAGAWRSTRRGGEAVCTALAALHAYRADHDYVVRDGRVEIVDRVTGRTAAGRVWSRGLHGLIELKEGCRVSDDTRTIAQITYQRFFPRYLRLCGMSGTLVESRRELTSTYGLSVVRVPLSRPCRRMRLPVRLFADAATRWEAVVERAAALQASGRPVLVGTDSVADSQVLAARLEARGVAHRLLNARQDAREAATVAHAGDVGAVTISTNMAGRGTDIVLADGVAARGGLHVISCQRNGARRIDRQLEGRCARQGDPGSVETWLVAGAQPWPGFVVRALARFTQRITEHDDAARRRELVRADREWERRATFAPPAE